MGGRNLRVFHISDLHMQSADGLPSGQAPRDAAFRWRVLGKNWQDNLATLCQDGMPFDLVVFTGDLADRGHPTDYPRAIAFLKNTCAALGVPVERLFVVPGNHDIDRTIQRAAWESLRRDIATYSWVYSHWMAGDDREALRGDDRRDQILERQRAFWSAVAMELGRPELEPRHSPHKRLGYRQTVMLPGLTQPIHVIGLDTAWLAGDEHDSGSLQLTEHQVALLTTTDNGEPLPGLRLALMHHRLADLADAASARGLLADRVDLLLHGHQHELTAAVIQRPEDPLLVLAAGCLYEGDEQHRYLNTCQVIDLQLDENARPRSANIRFRGWAARGQFWRDDALLYQNVANGRLPLRYREFGWSFDVRGSVHEPLYVERGDVVADLDSLWRERRRRGDRISSRFDVRRGRDPSLDRRLLSLVEIWDRAEVRTEVRVGLGLLCAAREALPIDVLGELAGWSHQEKERFAREAQELLSEETVSWTEEKAYGLYRGIEGPIAERLGAVTLGACHGTLAQKLATWPVPLESTGRRYALRYALIHRTEAGAWADAWRLAADMSFLEAKCRELGAPDAEIDVARAAEHCLANGKVVLFRRFSDLAYALARESNRLRAAPEATAALVWNRLWRLGWSVDDLEVHLQVPAKVSFLRMRHGPTQETPGLVRDLTGHSHPVRACAGTLDGRRVVSASEDRTLKIWDVERGCPLATLEGHTGRVTACAVTADGRRLVSASEDGTLKVWELEIGRVLATVNVHAGPVNACAVTSDSRRVVSASEDGTVKVWELESGRVLTALEGHTHGVWACAVTPDDQRVVSASFDRTVKVWELESGRMLATLEGHTRGVRACTVTVDGRRAISASGDHTLRVWDLESGRALATLEGHDDIVLACAVTANGRHVVSASKDWTLRVWDLDTYECFYTHWGDVAYTAVITTTTGVIAGDAKGSVWVLDWPSSKLVKTIRGIVETDWRDPGPVLRVVDNLGRVAATVPYTLGLEDIQRMASVSNLQESLRIAEYLASERVGLLNAQFKLVDHDRLNDLPDDLPDETVYVALRTGVLRDPQTGNVIDEWLKRVVLSYQTSPVMHEEG